MHVPALNLKLENQSTKNVYSMCDSGIQYFYPCQCCGFCALCWDSHCVCMEGYWSTYGDIHVHGKWLFTNYIKPVSISVSWSLVTKILVWLEGYNRSHFHVCFIFVCYWNVSLSRIHDDSKVERIQLFTFMDASFSFASEILHSTDYFTSITQKCTTYGLFCPEQ